MTQNVCQTYSLRPEAPNDPEVTDYDRAWMLAYARLLGTEKAERPIYEVGCAILNIDGCSATFDVARCIASHLQRAHEIVGS
jgi:hypothetical protein